MPDTVPQPKFVRDAMEIDDIEGVRSRRLFRGPTKDVFKVDQIEGAHPHKARRSPRSYAFDDYKDVTSKRHHRPFMNNSNSIENQYFNSGLSPEPRPLPKGNYKVTVDQYNNMNYYNLPAIDKKERNHTISGEYTLNSNLGAYNNRANRLQRNFNTLTFDNRNGENMYSGSRTQRDQSVTKVTSSPEYTKNLKKFYGLEEGDALDKAVRKQEMQEKRVTYMEQPSLRHNSYSEAMIK